MCGDNKDDTDDMNPLALATLIAAAVGGITSAEANDLPLGRHVLMLGDSYTVGGMGDAVYKELTARNLAGGVNQYSVCDSSPHNWIKATRVGTPCGYGIRNTKGINKFWTGTKIFEPFATMAKKENPDTFVFAFGDNFARYADGGSLMQLVENGAKKQVAEILAIAKRSPKFRKDRCFWITPTWGERPRKITRGMEGRHKNDKRLLELITWIREALDGHCQMIDSTQLPGMAPGAIKFKKNDAQHPDWDQGQAWGKAVVDEIERRVKGAVNATSSQAPKMPPSHAPKRAAPKTPVAKPEETKSSADHANQDLNSDSYIGR